MSESQPPFLPLFIGAIGLLTTFNASIYLGWRFNLPDDPPPLRHSAAHHSLLAASPSPYASDLTAATRRWWADQEAAYLEQIEIAESEEARRTLGVLLDAARAQRAHAEVAPPTP